MRSSWSMPTTGRTGWRASRRAAASPPGSGPRTWSESTIGGGSWPPPGRRRLRDSGPPATIQTNRRRTMQQRSQEYYDELQRKLYSAVIGHRIQQVEDSPTGNSSNMFNVNCEGRYRPSSAHRSPSPTRCLARYTRRIRSSPSDPLIHPRAAAPAIPNRRQHCNTNFDSMFSRRCERRGAGKRVG